MGRTRRGVGGGARFREVVWGSEALSKLWFVVGRWRVASGADGGSGIMRLLSACGSGIMRQGRLAMMFVIAQCAGGQLNCFELYSKRKAVCLVPYVPWCLDEVEWRGSGMGFVGMYCADFWYVGSRGYPGVGSMVGLVWDWFE